MKKFPLRSVMAVLIISCIGVLSCQKESINLKQESTAVTSKPDSMVLQRILSLGFKKENIVDKGKEYIVDGDIVFEKTLPGGQRVWTGSPVVHHTLVNGISIRVDNNFPNTAWRNRVIEALKYVIAIYNSTKTIVPNRIYMEYYDQAPATCTVSYDPSLPAGAYGQGFFPENCHVGHTVRLNLQSEVIEASRLQFIIAHEIGHILGFAHSDTQDGSYINGTLPIDHNSVFNSGPYWNISQNPQSVPQFQGFYGGDLTTFNIIYPQDLVVTGRMEGTWGGQGTLRFNWPLTSFCTTNPQVTILRRPNDGPTNLNIEIGSQAINKGVGTCSITATRGYTYTAIIKNPQNPNESLTGVYSVPIQ